MFAGHKRARLYLLPALLLFGLIYPLQQRLAARVPSEYNEATLSSATGAAAIREGGTFALMAMLGGFKPLVVNLLWMKTDEYWHQGATGYWRMVPILQAICEMDPHFIDAWSTFGYHCAWNIAADAPPEKRQAWVETGIEIYKKGQSFNQDKYDLYKDLAWLYHDKLRDYKRALPAWEETLKKPDAPIYVRHMVAHCYELTGQWQKAMEVWAECLRHDREDNVARSALAWWKVQSSTPEKLKAELERIKQREAGVRQTRGLPTAEQPYQIH